MTAWYRTGTCTATNGSGTVTGSLTAWLANAKVGDLWVPDADSKTYEITAIASNTSLTISPVYAGTTGGSKAYGIAKTSTAWNSASDLAVDIAEFISTYDPLGISDLSDPGADRVLFWDDSASEIAWLALSGLSISGTTLSIDTDLMSTARWTESILASSTTTDIGAATTPSVAITGTTTIASFGAQPNRLRILRFSSNLTITHNATTMILPNSADMTVVAGSSHIFTSDVSGNWRWRTGWSPFGGVLVTAASAAAARTLLGAQAQDADLDTIAALAKTDGNFIVGDGTNWVAESGATARTSLGAAASGANTDLTSVYVNNTGLKIKDTNASHGLSLVPGSDLSADRVLSIVTGDAARILDFSGGNIVTDAGTWTPVFSFLTPGTLSVSYSGGEQTGHYYKVGRLVFAYFRIICTPTLGTAASSASVTGLPYSSDITLSVGNIGAQSSNITWPSSRTFYNPIFANSTTLCFQSYGSGQSASNLAVANFTSGAQLTLGGTICYRTAS